MMELTTARPPRQKLDAVALYRNMLSARTIDRIERELVDRGEAFFHVSGAGHESTAALARHLRPGDYLHLHYRDKALMLARGVPVSAFFHALLCSPGSHSKGRQMSAHMSDPARGILSIVGPVGNSALQAVGVAQEIREAPERPIAVCGLGDGSTQQGEVLEALAEISREPQPVLFVVADNRYAISTPTRGSTFYETRRGPRDEFLDLPIRRVDGRDPTQCDAAFEDAVDAIRQTRAAQILIVDVERLADHTNADDQRVYRSGEELERAWLTGDPVARLKTQLVEQGQRTRAMLDALEAEVAQEVRAAAQSALSAVPVARSVRLGAASGLPAGGYSRAPERQDTEGLTIAHAMRAVLARHLEMNPRVSILGEDIEDPKGDVFGITRGLSTRFPGRVTNSALSEATIVGTSIGRALAGGRPVACIQFADFLPIAFNQIVSELATMSWRTAGGWVAPVVVLAPSGGYRPGLGPFHAQTYDSILAHMPGLRVLTPSSASDAAGLLNAALEDDGPSILLYPKARLHDPSLRAEPDALLRTLEPGRARHLSDGDDLTLVTWGACVEPCREATAHLVAAGIGIDLIDLRTLVPWDSDTVVRSVNRTGRLVVVHEDNLTAGFGAEIIATAAERATGRLTTARVTRPDTHVPCNYALQLEVLPSAERVIEASARMLGIELRWQTQSTDACGVPVEAIGSSPADQVVTVIEWLVRAGDHVEAGERIAECEADKATFELCAPTSGVVLDPIPEGVGVEVGMTLARIEPDDTGPSAPAEVTRRPLFSFMTQPVRGASPESGTRVGVASIARAAGARTLSNEELVGRFDGRSPSEIERLTGIRSRPVLAADETLTDIAAAAARSALETAGVRAHDLAAVVAATGTPQHISPGVGCEVLYALGCEEARIPAHDVSAACTGYLYALSTAFDICHADPEAHVLVITAEECSRYTDPEDFDTSVLFADAASATVLTGAAVRGEPWAQLSRPLLSTAPDGGKILSHGEEGHGPIRMNGKRVFAHAVREMGRILDDACRTEGLETDALEAIVPHQANARIISAMAQRAGVPLERVVDVTAEWGNTSSSSIPVALVELMGQERDAPSQVGLVAFGAGLTSGAAILHLAASPGAP